jgi:hypothetical protein
MKQLAGTESVISTFGNFRRFSFRTPFSVFYGIDSSERLRRNRTQGATIPHGR